jgi:hypothetical protein
VIRDDMDRSVIGSEPYIAFSAIPAGGLRAAVELYSLLAI